MCTVMLKNKLMTNITVGRVVFSTCILTLICGFVSIGLIFAYGISDLAHEKCSNAEKVFSPQTDTFCKSSISQTDCVDTCGCGWCKSTREYCLGSDHQAKCDGSWYFVRAPDCIEKYDTETDKCNMMKLMIIVFSAATVVLLLLSCILRSYTHEPKINMVVNETPV